MSETTLLQNVPLASQTLSIMESKLPLLVVSICVCLGLGCGTDRVNHLRAKTSQRNYSPSPIITTPLPLLHPPPTDPLCKPQTFHDTLPPSLSCSLSLPRLLLCHFFVVMLTLGGSWKFSSISLSLRLSHDPL